MMRLANCLCCSVKSRALIISIIGLLLASIWLVVSICILSIEDRILASLNKSIVECKSMLESGEISESECKMLQNWTHLQINAFRGVYVFCIFYCLFKIICYDYLLYGIIHHKNAMYVLWLIYHGLSISPKEPTLWSSSRCTWRSSSRWPPGLESLLDARSFSPSKPIIGLSFTRLPRASKHVDLASSKTSFTKSKIYFTSALFKVTGRPASRWFPKAAFDRLCWKQSSTGFSWHNQNSKASRPVTLNKVLVKYILDLVKLVFRIVALIFQSLLQNTILGRLCSIKRSFKGKPEGRVDRVEKLESVPKVALEFRSNDSQV